jgi:hypothetical protein
MRYLLIACEVLAREAYICAAHSSHSVDIQLLEKGLHDTPETLRHTLQSRIDAACPSGEGTGAGYDAVLLGYGLCSNSTVGLTARGVPLILPRAHDCITLYLGSRTRYEAEFATHPGTYYYTTSYVERSDGSSSVALGALSDEQRRRVYQEYVDKYGRDNADYLMEVMGAWASHYSRAAFIETGVGPSMEAEGRARAEAERRGWAFEKLAGDLILLRKLIDGEWDEDVLVIGPGEQVVANYGPQIVEAAAGS